MNHTLSKNERLHSKKSIKELFDKGSSFFLYPFKVLYLDLPLELIETNQVLFSVSKKKIKKAVDRNQVKRRIKEAYRLNKHLLANAEVKKKIALIYVSSDIPSFKKIEPVIQKILIKLDHLSNEIQKI
ncbi:ribonuclease P protein component [Belliella aquatica]|uniref:Ribonuclease P protein component n=1 Tax=Belliella aquatica TaxID=1323734 RepID=A0ABQ1MPH9_9BACT|nr:ribonuclease P protein component [Belliella aquatica]MCH7406225.1 ribonuclease P protein component [Belliella aquatica]GGC44260.1 ribonuclease P protein component [Belliella aquatica]